MHQAITLRSDGAKRKEISQRKCVFNRQLFGVSIFIISVQLNDSFCSLHFCQRRYWVGDVWSTGVCVFNAIEH